MDINGKNKVISLLRQQPRSRVELAKCTGLVKSSLTKITQQLLQDGLCEEVTDGAPASRGRQGGRPEVLLRLKPGVHHSVCFYISTESIICMMIDQTSAVIDSYEQRWDRSGPDKALSAGELVDHIRSITEVLCVRNGVPMADLMVITVATQGKLAQATGEVHYSQLLQQKHFKLAQAITEATGIEARIYNIAYCSSFRLKQLYSDRESFIAVLLGYGMGVGIVIDGRIVLGPDGTAPEISHVTYSAQGPLCYCGARGCAETYVTYHAILGEIGRLSGAAVPGADVMAQLEQVLVELMRHNTLCEQVIRQAGEVLGYVLAQLITIFDIKTIILNGEVSLFFPQLKAEIEAYLAKNSDYRFGEGAIEILHESDSEVAFAGLIELTNEAYLV